MWSRIPVWARPVRTLARSALNAWTLLSIFWSVLFFRSAITIAASSYVNQSSFVFAKHDPPQRVLFEDAEHVDRQLLVAAQRKCGGVHDLEVARNRLVEADLRVALCARIALRIRGVHAVD